MKDVLILRTHQEGSRLDDATAHYLTLSGLDLVVAADERRGAISMPHGVEKVGMKDALIEAMGLVAVPNWGWLCGDYALYAVRNAKPHYDRYWLIEPDVRISSADLDAFFDRFSALSDDFIAPLLGKRTPRQFYAAMAHFRPDVIGCLFPFVRVSAAAIDHLLQRRVELSQQWRIAKQNGSPIAWPNDEAFVATELRYAGFACSDLNAHGHKVYGSRFTTRVPVHHHAQFFAQPDELAYHPVLDDYAFLTRLERSVKSEKRPFGPLMDAALESLPRTPGKPHEMETSVIADGILAILLDLTKAKTKLENVVAVAAKHFGGSAPGAPIHQIVVGKKQRGWGVSNPDDFVCGPEVAAQIFPVSRATAYAADFISRELHFTCCGTDAPLLAAPFFYQAQRKHAISVTRVEFDRLADIYPDTDRDDLRPLIVMSIGRCGSTLLNRLLAVDGSTAVSEPDVFSQVPGLTGKVASQSGRSEQQARDDARAVLRATVQSLRTWADVPPDRLVIKLRAQANRAVEQIVAAFPQARFVFVFRDNLEGWVRSFVRAFGYTAPTLVHTLASGVHACDILQKRGVDLSVISYEMMTTDPAAIVQRVRGKEGVLTESQNAMVETAFSQDSQSGTSISRASRRERELTSCGQEQQTLTEFYALWREKRPAATISALRLPY